MRQQSEPTRVSFHSLERILQRMLPLPIIQCFKVSFLTTLTLIMVTRLSCLTGISSSSSQKPFDYLFQDIAQVTQQMPAVGDLSRIRSAHHNAVAISYRTITGNGFNARASKQSVGQSSGFAVGQQVNDFSSLQINDDGPISVAFAPRPIVHTDYLWLVIDW